MKLQSICILVLAILMAAAITSGCMAPAQDAAPAPTSTPVPTTPQTPAPPQEAPTPMPLPEKTTTEFMWGDIVQFSPYDPDYQADVALLVVEYNATHYVVEGVVKDKGKWYLYPGYRSPVPRENLEYHCDYIWWADPENIKTWDGE